MNDTTALKLIVILILGLIEMTLCLMGMGTEYLIYIIGAIMAVLGISYAANKTRNNSDDN